MMKLALAVLLVSSPVMAQSNPIVGGKSEPLQSGVSNQTAPPAPGGIANTIGQPDIVQSCYPIGKTVSGELVFSMDCKFPVTVSIPVGGTLSGSGTTGFTNNPNNPSGMPPTASGGNTLPSGYSNVTPEKK